MNTDPLVSEMCKGPGCACHTHKEKRVITMKLQRKATRTCPAGAGARDTGDTPGWEAGCPLGDAHWLPADAGDRPPAPETVHLCRGVAGA